MVDVLVLPPCSSLPLCGHLKVFSLGAVGRIQGWLIALEWWQPQGEVQQPQT